MPIYRLFYRITTPLVRQQDVTFAADPNPVTLLFSEKREGDSTVLARIDIQAVGYREAQHAAATFVPRVLDCLSFSTGVPMLLGLCELIFRSERGADIRRGVHTKERRFPLSVRLDQRELDFAQSIFDSAGPKLPLCWLRYSRQRELTLERFVFSWLGFEELAGDADIPATCAGCGEVATHRGADKARAWELFHAANPDVDRRNFDQAIWGRARNAMFHGSRYPDPNFLRDLEVLVAQLQATISRAVQTESQVEGVPNAPAGQHIFNYETYFSWRTDNRGESFPNDWPATELQRLAEQAEPGRWNVLRHDNLTLHNHVDFANW